MSEQPGTLLTTAPAASDSDATDDAPRFFSNARRVRPVAAVRRQHRVEDDKPSDRADVPERSQPSISVSDVEADSTSIETPIGAEAELSTLPVVLAALRIEPNIEQRMIAILDAPLRPGELPSVGFRRKEHELGSVLLELTAAESLVLYNRLAHPHRGDALAEKFARMTVERRTRLLIFLRDARRRAALAAGRR